MDSPHGVPETSSPVVLLPGTRTQFNYATARSGVATNATAATTPITNTSFPLMSHQARTRSFAAVTGAASVATRTNPSFSLGVPMESEIIRPTTRARKRSHNNIREISTESTSVLSADSPPSRKRKTPSSPAKVSRCNGSKINGCGKKPPPGASLKEDKSATDDSKCDYKADEKKPPTVDCCICMCEVERNDLSTINGCEHQFCFCCIERWSERENKCPLCKTRFTKIERVNKRKKKGMKSCKRVKQRDQRSDLAPNAAIEGLIANLNHNSRHLSRLIFGVHGSGFEFSNQRLAFSTTHTTNGARAEFVDEDSDDEDSPMAYFMRAIHGAPAANAVNLSRTVVNRPMTVTFTTTTRSFARNRHDSTAGNGADNPLEIDDDSVEEVIEIDD